MQEMKKGYKEIIAPIVAVVFMALKGIFDLEFPEGLQYELVESLAYLLVVVISIKGIVEDHFDGREAREKRKLEKKKDKNFKSGGDK